MLDAYTVYLDDALANYIQYEEFMYSALDNPQYALTFSGHETFPLRQTWLKKVVKISTNGLIEKKKFSDPQQLAELGVGKNMLASMKYWALACGVIEEYDNAHFKLTELAEKVFSDDGFDPFSESVTTTWLLHWILASSGYKATSIYYVFNRLNTNKFRKNDVKEELENLISSKGKRVSLSSLSKDLDILFRSYSLKLGGSGRYQEDFAEPVFSELGLINQDENGVFSFNRGPKESLNNHLFVYALLSFWDALKSHSNTLSLDMITYAEGSPGRVFKLDENSVAERLLSIAELTQGKLIWSDSAGIKQILRTDTDFDKLKMTLLEKAYE
ncbi:DUF4007 family protein [Vibrio cholerae]|uniref:DUF4007 family protein n=1 Tax=Vibrio cholerae TaxID=666 RepID=UPI0011D9C16C|nr:DUF4007 family protein [Vibrio cholerae]EGQ7789044.1 DUF4007 family protein [Vibrio cholerae]EGR0785447.1 DUF4007 family protein [Vibrio cholerae]EGR1129483.1 DUF4007 family protein [Vibrio cholerae]EJL6499866.1 DUF4007 family protein [Vibrio cholerae]EJL6876813.1 DUF4007 family protein [Vibrio cholerae]